MSEEEGMRVGLKAVMKINAMKYELVANMGAYLDEGKVGELVANNLELATV